MKVCGCVSHQLSIRSVFDMESVFHFDEEMVLLYVYSMYAVYALVYSMYAVYALV